MKNYDKSEGRSHNDKFGFSHCRIGYVRKDTPYWSTILKRQLYTKEDAQITYDMYEVIDGTYDEIVTLRGDKGFNSRFVIRLPQLSFRNFVG